MGKILEPPECIAIRARGAEEDPQVLALEFGVSVVTISNVLSDRSYARPECYAEGSRGRAAAEQRQWDYQEERKRQRQMRYVSATKRAQVLERDAYRCVYCQADLTQLPPVIDHRVPVTRGGTNDIENLQATCKTCNARKKDFPDDDEGKLREYLEWRRSMDPVMSIFESLVTEGEWLDEDDIDTTIREGWSVCYGSIDASDEMRAAIQAIRDGEIDKARNIVTEIREEWNWAEEHHRAIEAAIESAYD